MLAVTVRPASPADAHALADLHMRSASEGFSHIFPASDLGVSHEEMCADWFAVLESDPALARTTFVAEAGSDLVGVIVATVDPVDQTVGRVSRLYVDPTFWRSRAAAKLLDSATNHLRDLGCHVALAWIMEPNARAQRTVEHLGARRTGARHPTCEKAASAAGDVEDVEYALLLDPSAG